MEFAVGSHPEGHVSAADSDKVAARYPIEAELAKAGDVLILHMLTLHRSGSSYMADPRHIIRLDYGPDIGAMPTRGSV